MSDYGCTFGPGGWNPEDWLEVRSPRWDHPGGWVQGRDHIANKVPADATAEEMLGPRGGETYSSMVLAGPPARDWRVQVRAAFDHRMAPLVVLAGPLGSDRRGMAEYREHVEIVLYDEGVNVWHHTWTEGRPAWTKAAWWRFDLEPDEPHTLIVDKRGPDLSVAVGDRRCGCRLSGLDDAVRPGITGCEGVNRFYEFAATTPEG